MSMIHLKTVSNETLCKLLADNRKEVHEELDKIIDKTHGIAMANQEIKVHQLVSQHKVICSEISRRN